MSKLTLTPEAKEKITKKIQGPAKILLSLDDGVGPYSIEGSCTIPTSFDVIAVKPDAKTPDYNKEMDSDLGPIYYKDYSGTYFAKENPKLKLNNNNLLLSDDGGSIDDNVSIIDKR